MACSKEVFELGGPILLEDPPSSENMAKSKKPLKNSGRTRGRSGSILRDMAEKARRICHIRCRSREDDSRVR